MMKIGLCFYEEPRQESNNSRRILECRSGLKHTEGESGNSLADTQEHKIIDAPVQSWIGAQTMVWAEAQGIQRPVGLISLKGLSVVDGWI